jgi:hypothetical protein
MAKKHFFHKLLNADDAPMLVDGAELINISDLRFGTSDSGEIGGLENIKGTVKLFDAISGEVPAGCRCIGGASDEANRYIVWFTHTPGLSFPPEEGVNLDGDDYNQILLYDKNTGFGYLMVDSFDVKLNFNPSNLIQASIVNNTVYWTDGSSEGVRQLHLGAAIKMSNGGVSPIEAEWQYKTDGMVSEDISLMKKAPTCVPQILKLLDVAFIGNMIGDDSFQFCYQYVYWNGEVSTLGFFSRSSLLNAETDNSNKITVTMPVTETISDIVRCVRLIAKEASTARYFVAKEWDRKQSATEITNHNAGSALTFDFYNNTRGQNIDSATAALPYYYIPNICKTLCFVKNRLFLGDNEDGYDSPKSTSLSVNFSWTHFGLSSIISKPVLKIQHLNFDVFGSSHWYNYTGYYVYLTEVLPVGYYLINGCEGINATGTAQVLPPNPPATTSIAGLTFKGATIADVVNSTRPAGKTSTTGSGSSATSWTLGITGTSTSFYNVFKSMQQTRYGIVFFDKYQRKCGVVTKDGLTLTLPGRDYGFGDAVTAINWTLSNSGALDEIPDWAHYYAIVSTKDLRTRYFVQFVAEDVKYATPDPANSESWLTSTSGTKPSSCVGVSVSFESLKGAGIGYVFTEGDYCVLWGNDGWQYTIPIKKVNSDGKTLLLHGDDIRNITTSKFIGEIYRPYKAVAQEPFYEIGELYEIVNPGTSSRLYSALAGSLQPDTFAFTRNWNTTTYITEAMSPNDKFYQRWDTNHSRVNYVTAEGRKRNKTSLRFSNVFIPGTQTNGLSSFEPLNEEVLAIELGSIMKLVTGSKVQTDGSVLLAIGQSESASIYIGEARMSDSENNTFLVKTNGVIGDVNILSGSSGTMHPESVVVNKGRIFWLDAMKGQISTYSKGGLFELSSYKLRRPALLACKKLLGMTNHVPGGYDPFHNELLLSLPQTETAPPKGTLTDFTSPTEDYPYDFYDGKAKTWVCKTDADKFQGSLGFVAEYFVCVGEALFSFKNGALYEHNKGAYNQYYGESVTPALAFVENGEPDSSVKIFRALALEASCRPKFTHIRTEVADDPDYVQSSDIDESEWKLNEGVFEAAILRDRLSPNTPGTVYDKLLFGDEMKGQWARILMKFGSDNVRQQIRFVNVTYSTSSGHQNI